MKMIYRYLLSGMLGVSIVLTSVLTYGQYETNPDVYLTVMLKKTSYKKPLSLTPDYFRGLEGVKELEGDRILVYVYGNVKTMKEAKKLMKAAEKAGYTAHKIIGVSNGLEIPTSQAENIIEEQEISAQSLAENTKPEKEKKSKKDKKKDEEESAPEDSESAYVFPEDSDNKEDEDLAAKEAADEEQAQRDADAAAEAVQAAEREAAEAEFGSLEDIAPSSLSDEDEAAKVKTEEDVAAAAEAKIAEAREAAEQEAAAAKATEDKVVAARAAAEAEAAAAEEEQYGSIEDIASSSTQKSTSEVTEVAQQSELADSRPSINSSPEPSKPTSSLKVYIGDDGKYFIQKSLPIYLYFSTSPGGEKLELKSKRTAKYASPMYLDTDAGDMTVTAPSGASDVVRVVAHAVTTEPNTFFFNPSQDWIVIAA